MIFLTLIVPPVDISHLTPSYQQFFGKYLRKKDKWLTLDEAQRQAYQMVLVVKIGPTRLQVQHTPALCEQSSSRNPTQRASSTPHWDTAAAAH